MPYRRFLQRSVAAIKTAPSVLVIFTFALLPASESRAQDPNNEEPFWSTFDNVLVVPPVYGPNSVRSDGCGEDCNGSNDENNGELPSSVAGTADNPENSSAGTADDSADDGAGENASAPDTTDWQAQDPGSSDSQGINSLEAPIGSAQEYEQQAAIAADLGSYGITPPPLVIFAAPIGLYRHRVFSPSVPIVAPAREVPRPLIAPHIVSGTTGGFHNKPFGGFPHEGFSHMSGFHGGFGHR
jgi:hypothetical protein